MDPIFFRILAAALIVVILAFQARRAGGAKRRRAFGLGAAAFTLIGIGNLLGLYAGGWALLPTLAGSGLIVASLFTLFDAYRSGELNAEMRQARERLLAERRSAEEAVARRREGSGDSQGTNTHEH